MSATTNSRPRFRGLFGRSLEASPFVDRDLLGEASSADYNTAANTQKLRLALLVLFPFIIFAEGEHIFRIEGQDGFLRLAFVSVAISIVLFFIEGLLVRSIVLAGAVARSPLGSLAEVVGLFARATGALAAAAIISVNLAVVFYGSDIAQRHRQDWELRNADALRAANNEFDARLRPYQLTIDSLQAALSAVPATDPTIEEINGRNELAATQSADLLVLRQEHALLVHKQDCELDGYVCLGASGVPDDGPLYYALENEIREKVTQIELLNASIEENENALTQAIARRDSIDKLKADLRVKLINAERALIQAGEDRSRFVSDRVPYILPGPMEQFTALWLELIDHPVNFLLTGLWVAWVFSMDMAVVTSAFALRTSEYGVQLRRRLAHAETRSKVEAIEDDAWLAATKETARQEVDDLELRTIFQRIRNRAMHTMGQDHREAAE